MPTSKLWTLLERVSTVAVVVVSGLLLWTYIARRPVPRLRLPSEPISYTRSPTTGSADAQSIMIVYSDFQCPYCGRFARDTWPLVKAKYVDTGKLLVAFWHFPLPIHPRAGPAAEAAECAGTQGKFWEMHDQLFSEPMRLSDDDLRKHAESIGVEARSFDVCMSGVMTSKVKSLVSEALQIGQLSTPTLLFGKVLPGQRAKISASVEGAVPFASVESVIGKLLKAP
jgi:protein-disulfide isomerase